MILKKTKGYSGLQAFFADIYSYIGGGLLLTGVMSYAVVKMINDGIIQTMLPLKIAMILVFIYGIYISYVINNLSALQAQCLFWSYVLLQGFITGFFIYMYQMFVAEAFVITAGIFITMGLLSRVSKFDISSYGNFFTMTTIAIFATSILNVFIFKSGTVMLGIDIAVLLIFSVLIMYNHQVLEKMYHHAEDKKTLAIMGALSLYNDIVVLFRTILRLLAAATNRD